MVFSSRALIHAIRHNVPFFGQMVSKQKYMINKLWTTREEYIKLCFGLHKRHYSSFSKRKLNIGIIGAPLCKGQQKQGVEEAPSVIRKFGLIDRLQELGHDIKDYGDVIFDNVECSSGKNNILNSEYIGAANRKLSDTVYKIINDGKICLTLGGDHSLVIGTIIGHCLARSNICLLFVDAHADLNTPKTSLSGNAHGMGLSFLLKEMQKYVDKTPGFEWIKPCISKKNLAYIALRCVDPPERKFLEELNIKYYSMREVDKLGIYNIVNMALENINPSGNLPLHVSFDIDALDKMIAPSTGTPVAGGLTLREALVIAEESARTGNLSALDLVEVNPKLCHTHDMEKTVFAALDIISAFFYNERAGNIYLNDITSVV